MNVTTINTDGVCVFVHTKVHPDKAIKILVVTAIISIFTGIILSNYTEANTTLNLLAMILLFGGIVVTLPMLRTILWNLYGEERISFSTKSIVCELTYGIFKLAPKTYTYDRRLKFQVEIRLIQGETKSGLLHFYSYDENNQPFHLFHNVGYLTEKDCYELVNKIQLIFALDKDQFTEYSAN